MAFNILNPDTFKPPLIPIPNSKADIGTVAASLPDHNSLQGPAFLRE